MRKITLLMGLLLSLLGAAQVSAQDYKYSGSPISTTSGLTSGRYLISVHSKGLEGLLYWSNTGIGTSFSVSSTKASSKTSATMTASGEDAKFMWDIVVDNEGNFTIQSVSSSSYTSKMGEQDEGKHNVKYVSAGDANIGKHQLKTLVNISGIPHFTVKLANGTFQGGGTATYFHCNGSNLGTTGNHMHLSYWSGESTSTYSNNTCVKMAFYRLIPDLGTSTFTYDYQINGVSMKTEEHIVGNGEAFPNLTLPLFCNGTKPEGTVSAEDDGETKVIDVTWTGPFDYTSSAEDNVAKWYQLTLHRHNFVMKNNATNNQVNFVGDKADQYVGTKKNFTLDKDEHWAFVGNPFDGFQIYSRKGGRIISGTTSSSVPYVSTSNLTNSQVDKWILVEQGLHPEWSDITITNGFSIYLKGYPNLILNLKQDQKRLQYWENNKDNGSTFVAWKNCLPQRSLNTVDGTSYASFFVDYPVKVTSDNVKVYTGTINGNSLEMTEAGDKIIPANVGVVLISETGATTAEISISDEAGTLALGSLTGTTTGLNIGDQQSNYLVLGRKTGDTNKVGFYQPTGTQIPANKAYIYLAGGNVQGLVFNFDGATTDINNISATTNKQEIYDLSGRRVMKANKGLYIINGKKCFIK